MPKETKKPLTTKYQELREKYSPEEITLLSHLEHESKYMHALGQNNGKRQSPIADEMRQALMKIDTADQFATDNWVPRSGTLIRQTG